MYQPILKSIRQHTVPDWYHDAKFGIFIHWTISSVPGFAPTGVGNIHELFKGKSQEFLFANQPYAEWYQNSLRIPGSPVQAYHHKTYGADYPYERFGPIFNEHSRLWDPQSWAELFQQVGARYAVLVTKHHDGFLLWPSRHLNPHRPDFHSQRDIVGELTEAVSARGIKMGLYYSSALDWTFTPGPIRNFTDLATSGPTNRQYRDYVEAHWMELIERYQPWLLWSDIGYPPGYSLPRLFAYYYNRQPEGVVNDRWMQLPAFFYTRIGRWIIDRLIQRAATSEGSSLPDVPHRDYRTTEYVNLNELPAYKWESVRGIGNSFAYNQFEQESDYLQAPALIRMLADLVSKNGNLLLNIGPRPDGSIPEPQVRALTGLGRWLAQNGDAIYATRPWTTWGEKPPEGGEVRYTCRGDLVYAILTGLPVGGQIRLAEPAQSALQAVRLLDSAQPLSWQTLDGRVQINLPPGLDPESVPVLELSIHPKS